MHVVAKAILLTRAAKDAWKNVALVHSGCGAPSVWNCIEPVDGNAGGEAPENFKCIGDIRSTEYNVIQPNDQTTFVQKRIEAVPIRMTCC